MGSGCACDARLHDLAARLSREGIGEGIKVVRVFP